MLRTLAYRSAAVAGVGPLFDKLRREDVMHRVRWLCLLGLGLIALWAAPAIVSWRIYVRRAWVDPNPTPWPVMMLICSAVMIPILFAVEHATRGKFLENSLGRLGIGGGGSMFAGFAYADGMGLLIIFEVFLWGPRMTLAATRHLRAAAAFSTASFAEGAAVLSTLLRHDDGQPVGDVMFQAQLEPSAFADALAYLAFHDYIGIAKDGTRVWLNTDARRRLT